MAMTNVDRRTLLRAGAASALAGPFTGFFALQAQGAPRMRPARGDLYDVRDKRDGVVRLQLPRGFQYRSFQHKGELLGDGVTIPGRHDGMAAFAGPHDHVRLVRNHEVLRSGSAFASGPVYDPAAQGGTTSTLVSKAGVPGESGASLAGTMGNCSGGPMPWGSWVTCEETINGPDVFDDFQFGGGTSYVDNVNLQEKHGYVFEVPAVGQSAAEPITQAGRFSHEAIVYSPDDEAFYLTEDDFGFPSGFYRYVPKVKPSATQQIADGGDLYMLAVTGAPNAHLEGVNDIGATFDVSWVRIPDPDPSFRTKSDKDGGIRQPTTTNDEAIRAVAEQGWLDRRHPTAYFGRLEGAVYDSGVVYFTATQGGGAPEHGFNPKNPKPAPDGFGNGRGQIWAYHVREQFLELVYVSPGADVLDFPDNITTSPSGTLVICEDGSDGNYLRGLGTDGQLFDIAQNLIPKGTDIGGDEFAGSTFSPDGETLFVNIQASTGMSIAIWGPWEDIGV
jgi:secreted PhoX family phosphatase